MELIIAPIFAQEKDRWMQWIAALFEANPDQKIYLDFSTWDESLAENMSVREIVNFLYELKHRWPKISWDRYPGTYLWDPRITEACELEALMYEILFDSTGGLERDLSVIIPSYNTKIFLANVIRHLNQQNYDHRHYEVIVVDDGGNDGSFEYLQLCAFHHGLNLKYIYWHRNEARERGKGIYRAGLSRNLGVRECKSEKIVFLDSDMIVPQNFVETVIQELDASKVIQFPRYHIQQAKSSLQTHYKEVGKEDLYVEEAEYWNQLFECSEWQNLSMFWKFTCTYALGLLKESFYSAGRFPHFYVSYGFEDTELGYRLAKLGMTFKLVKLPVYHLTSYSLSEYKFSKSKRQKLLKQTAKLFFLNTLDINVFHSLESLMLGEDYFLLRLKNKLLFSRKKLTK
jgi:glycosyltransferase involved in cell wall biosynthesis